MELFYCKEIIQLHIFLTYYKIGEGGECILFIFVCIVLCSQCVCKIK